MANKDTGYRRVTKRGQAEEKMVLWLPVEAKEAVRRLAAERDESMNDTVTEAVVLLIARWESAQRDAAAAVARDRAERARQNAAAPTTDADS
jgi:hypothetical protein